MYIAVFAYHVFAYPLESSLQLLGLWHDAIVRCNCHDIWLSTTHPVVLSCVEARPCSQTKFGTSSARWTKLQQASYLTSKHTITNALYKSGDFQWYFALAKWLLLLSKRLGKPERMQILNSWRCCTGFSTSFLWQKIRIVSAWVSFNA